MSELFTNLNPWALAGLIFLIRVLNMALNTMRMLTTLRGMRGLTWILGVFQTILLLISLGSVLDDLDNFLNITAYATGFATGNVIGMAIDKRLALGYINLTIMSSHAGKEIAVQLRKDGHAVTEIPARGKDGIIEILECSIQRKFGPDVQALVNEFDPDAFITSRDIQRLNSGYWRE